MRSAFVLLIGAALLSGIPARAATPAAATRGWIARCVAQLAAEAGMDPGEWIRWRALNAAAEDGIPVPADLLERRTGHGH